jgi:hypothetical protein
MILDRPQGVSGMVGMHNPHLYEYRTSSIIPFNYKVILFTKSSGLVWFNQNASLFKIRAYNCEVILLTRIRAP